MQSGELLAFFQEYAVLARLAVTVTDFWVNNTNEFLQRLASDWLDIQKNFQGNAELGQVVAIHAGLSDLHENGRSVMAITFDSGLTLIYKPKDLGSEEAYFKLLAWLNQRKALLPFKLLKMINRSNYGWVEYVEHLPCSNQQEVVRYYQRAGMLLCLLYALNGTDYHSENIIACGEYPVAIDLEMLISHRVRDIGDSGSDTQASSIASQQVMDSVVHTSFLPKWQLGPDGLAYDVSALAGFGDQQTNFRVLKWRNINTDSMVLGYEHIKTQPNANVVFLDGVTISPSDYVEELVDGFTQMYQFLVSHRKTLLAPNGHHLLNNRTVSDAGYKAWATINQKLLTGFSHGAAGIAYALLRLYDTTQNPVFKEAACEAIAYERSVFSPTVQNWADLRSEKTVFSASWCHGAPGIALARLGGLTILDTSEIRQEIKTVLQTTQKLSLQEEINHLCCGNFGRIDVLLVAAEQLKLPEFLEIAHQQAAWIVSKAENAGYSQIFPNENFKDIYNPGFFQGTSGIGYELLRLAYPQQLPSVLLWE